MAQGEQLPGSSVWIFKNVKQLFESKEELEELEEKKFPIYASPKYPSDSKFKWRLLLKKVNKDKSVKDEIISCGNCEKQPNTCDCKKTVKKPYIGLYLQYMEDQIQLPILQTTFSVLNTMGVKIFVKSKILFKVFKNIEYGISDFMSLKKLKELNIKDLTIHCDFEIVKKDLESYKLLFNNELESDIELKVTYRGGLDFDGEIECSIDNVKAHKLVLAMSSLYFRDQFGKNDLVSYLEVDLCPPHCNFDRLLRYIYTGVEDYLSFEAYYLFAITSEYSYNVSDLHIKCKELLIRNLSDHNFVRTIIACNLSCQPGIHEIDVFDECKIFLKKNFVAIMNTNTFLDWNELLQKIRPTIIQDLLLSFCCCLDISKCRKKINTENSAEYVSKDSCPKEFEALWNEKTNSDIEIHIRYFSQREYKIQKYSAHKVVLSTRSSYFRRIFETSKNSNVIDLPPFIEFEIFNEVLRYIYTNRVENLDKLAGGIFTAANFFSIDDLQFECEKVLENTMSLKNDSTNILHMIITAYDYDAERLKHKALEFIIEKIFFCPDSKSVFKRSFRGVCHIVPQFVVFMVDVLKKMASDYELYYLY